jgi:NhaP-type Na+/H+ or K+/H+ antiporter
LSDTLPAAAVEHAPEVARQVAHHVSVGPDPALTLSLALVVGVAALAVSRHLRIPGIVLLLGCGVLLGPDVANIIQPATIADAMHRIIGFAVAIILFEGGMNLQFRRLRKESRVIQQLITLGALTTTIGGALAARYLLGWDWRTSILFGTLVIVTGPTVITPLLRRIRVKRSVETILEAEGILIDAVGAVTAVVAVQIALQPSMSSLTEGAFGFIYRMGLGSWPAWWWETSKPGFARS